MATTLRLEDLRQDLLVALVGRGMPATEAEKLAAALAGHLFKRHRGTRPYWQKGRKRLGLTVAQRREIYRAWWVDRTPDEEICQQQDISETTLRRIKAEGRRQKWHHSHLGQGA